MDQVKTRSMVPWLHASWPSISSSISWVVFDHQDPHAFSRFGKLTDMCLLLRLLLRIDPISQGGYTSMSSHCRSSPPELWRGGEARLSSDHWASLPTAALLDLTRAAATRDYLMQKRLATHRCKASRSARSMRPSYLDMETYSIDI